MKTPVSIGHAPSAKLPDEIFVGRQPIVNNSQRIFGYELLFRRTQSSTTSAITSDVEATGRVLINTFNNIGLERVLEGRKAFVNVSEDLLHSDIIEALPKATVVIELLETIEPRAEIIGRVQDLKNLGYQFALDDFVYRPDYEPLIKLVSYIKFDVRELGVSAAIDQMRQLRGRGLSFLAEKVETRQEFEACRGSMFNFYQGYFFAEPETLSMKRVDPKAALIMSIYNLVRTGTDDREIEDQFKKDVALSFQLLRFINSAGMGLRHKIDSIGRALVILGKDKLVRWLSLLMMSPGGGSEAPNAVFKTALTRARMAEILAKGRLSEAQQDQLFMAGMFSLLDVVLSLPLEQLLKSLSLPETVSDALLHQTGPLVPFLSLSEAVEKMDIEQIIRLSSELNYPIEVVSLAHMEALTWSEGMGQT